MVLIGILWYNGVMESQEKPSQKCLELPAFFRPLLWSYDISRVDLQRDRKVIMVNTLNYGDLKHWRWLVSFYGADEVREMITRLPATELRDRVRRLVELLFNIHQLNHASRGTH